MLIIGWDQSTRHPVVSGTDKQESRAAADSANLEVTLLIGFGRGHLRAVARLEHFHPGHRHALRVHHSPGDRARAVEPLQD